MRSRQRDLNTAHLLCHVTVSAATVAGKPRGAFIYHDDGRTAVYYQSYPQDILWITLGTEIIPCTL